MDVLVPPPLVVTSSLGRFALDAEVRRTTQGRTLLGGSPFRLLRLSSAGTELLNSVIAGDEIPDTSANRKLVDLLVDGGLMHPIVETREVLVAQITVVIPVFGDATGLAATLAALCGEHGEEREEREHREANGVRVIVVDDGSDVVDATRIDAVVERFRSVELIRLSNNQGPAAARNVGWRKATTPLVAFLDADVVARDFLASLLGHFDDSIVAAVAPRVTAPNPQRSRVAGSGKPAPVLNRYERVRSALDMGHRPASVAPRRPVSYVPSAALIIRRSVLNEVGGFDESLRFGEDVDLVWRIGAAGHVVRYEPFARVEHRNRETWERFIAQRMSYGGSAAPLEQRHPGSVVPVEIGVRLLSSWVLLAAGGPRGALLGIGIGAAGVAPLAKKISGSVDKSVEESARLNLRAQKHSGHWLAAAVTRNWLPLAVVGSFYSSRVRRATAAAVVVPAAVEWVTESPDLDIARWTAARLLDDASYCAGVWQGAFRARSARVLLPKISGW